MTRYTGNRRLVEIIVDHAQTRQVMRAGFGRTQARCRTAEELRHSDFRAGG